MSTDTFPFGITGLTLNFIYLKDGLVWDKTAESGAGAYVTPVSGNFSNYAFSATDSSSIGVYTASTPSGILANESYILTVWGSSFSTFYGSGQSCC
jgi:hypothetical protein